jgi:hypothetical protein
MATDEPASTGGNPVKRFFAQLGVVTFVLGLVVAAVGLDLALTDAVGPLTSESGEDAVDLVTADGRELGWAAPGIRLVHTPLTVYENFPNQAVGRYRINSVGLRGPEISPTRDRPRVIVVGGSAAFGLGVADSETLSAALSRRIDGLEVLNAGVIGYQSSQDLALTVHRLLDLQPDLIVAFNGWNDLFDAFWWERFGDGESEYRRVNVIFNGIEKRLLKYREIEWNPGYSLREATLSIVRNSTMLSALYRSLPRVSGPEAASVSHSTDPESIARIADHYASNMIKLRDFARARGSELLVVVQPEHGQVLDADARAARSRGELPVWPAQWYWSSFPTSYLQFRNRDILVYPAGAK